MPTTPILGLPYPTVDDQPHGPNQIQALAMAVDPLGVVPVGAMALWPGAASPSGWLLMLGQVIPASQYPGLAAVLGQDGSGNVTVPDMRDRFPVGAGPTMPLAQLGGASAVQLTDRQSGMRTHSHGGITTTRDRSQNHTHQATDQGGYFALYAGGGGVIYYNGTGEARPGATATGATDPSDHAHYIYAEAAANALDAHENRPPYRAVNFIIRAG